MSKIVIFGAGDIAKLAYFYFKTDSKQEVVAFAVDAKYKKGDQFEGLPLVSFEEVQSKYPASEFKMFVALSYQKMNKLREEKYCAAKEMGYTLVSYISSRCSFLSQFPAGDNCFILEDNTIQPFSRIGNNVTLWSGNHIGHDAVIEDHCFISSHVVISGYVKVSRNCFLGVNSTFRNSITIGKENIIGAGAVIMKDTQDFEVYVPKRTEVFYKKSSELEL
jgi:sugar O-acyltransferase (sialic acid O-acetyltransferase NeuD family)